jgi:hypothetical protein
MNAAETVFDWRWRLLLGAVGAVFLWGTYDAYEAHATGWEVLGNVWVVAMGGGIGLGLIGSAITGRWVFGDEAPPSPPTLPAESVAPPPPVQRLTFRGRAIHTIVGIGVFCYLFQAAGSFKEFIFAAVNPLGPGFISLLGAVSLWGGITGRDFWGPFMRYPTPPDGSQQ